MILVVCALLRELRDFDAPPDVRVLAVGVGPVEAALGTARALALGRYDAVINAGIGGAFRGRARVGDAVVVERETLADFGLEGGGALQLPDGARTIEVARADATLVARCARTLPLASGITVSSVTTTDATAARLTARYAAGVESMEGFAVLRAAQEAGVPAIELRGISNYVGDRAAAEWDFTAGAKATVRGLAAILPSVRLQE